MKKEDAIHILTAMKKSYLSLGIPDPEAVEALEIAINAVKATAHSGISEQIETLEKLPVSICQTHKTGHWTISPNDYFVHCSECGLHGDKGIYKHYKWCPNCGAKMEEEE